MRVNNLIPDTATILAGGDQCAFPIVRDFLIPFYRHDRIPLGSWAQLVIDRFDQAQLEARRDPYKACEIMTDFLNEAALIEVYFGRSQHAKDLCRASISLTTRVLDLTGRLSVVRFMFQPFINEGRLDRIQGQWDEALDKFRRLSSFRCGDPITIGCFRVSESHWAAIKAETCDFLSRMNASYLIDSLATFLKADRFSEALDFIKENESTEVHWFDHFLPEAGVIALCSLGFCEVALKITDEFLGDLRNPHRAVFLYRRAEILTHLGENAAAARIVRGLATAHLNADIPANRVNLKLVSRLANSLTNLGDDLALPFIKLGLDYAGSINDVVFQQEFLTLLIRLTPTTSIQSERAKRRLDELPRESWYGAARSPMPKDWFVGDTGMIDVMHRRALSLPDAFS